MDNQLKVLDVSKNINLQTLDCFANQLTVLDVSKNVDLLYFWCYNNPIKTICVADITKANISISTKDTFGDFYWRKGQTATYEVCK
jgi:Leucine-rich repeat (LRR) protein